MTCFIISEDVRTNNMFYASDSINTVYADENNEEIITEKLVESHVKPDKFSVIKRVSYVVSLSQIKAGMLHLHLDGMYLKTMR